MAKIETLTTEQEAQLSVWCEKWIAIGLSTDPADRPKAEAAIVELYQCAELKPPSVILWAGSPLSMALACAASHGADSFFEVEDGTKLPDTVEGADDDTLNDAMVRLTEHVLRQLTEKAPVSPSVMASAQECFIAYCLSSGTPKARAILSLGLQSPGCPDLPEAVTVAIHKVEKTIAPSRRKLIADARTAATERMHANLGQSVRDSIYGAHDAGWLSFYDYFREVVGLVAETDPVRGLIALAKSAGWAMPYENVCWVSERHSRLARDNEHRLHSIVAPAVTYPDGWKLYAVHGVLVPDEWVEKRDTLDPKTALTWPNIEQRRAAAEILGWERVLRELKPKVIDKDPDPEVGTLLCVDLPDSPKSFFLQVMCATKRSFVLPVPNDMRTARQANKWTYSEEESAPDDDFRT